MTKVCVLFGGASSEHEVSLRSASAVLENMPTDRYETVAVGITQDGRWLLYSGGTEEILNGTWEHSGKTCPAVLSPDTSHKGLLVLEDGAFRCLPVDAVFPVLHGKNGEDGTVQGLLDLCGIPYVGCGVLSSAVCMDKAVAHVLLEQAGIPKTKLEVVRVEDLSSMEMLQQKLLASLGYPMFVKPANAGSSVGVTRVDSPQGLKEALSLAFRHDTKAVVEQAVIGQEVECAVMGNGEPVASSVIGEIAPPDGVYDYESKYMNDSAGLYIPANLAPETAEKIRKTAVAAYKALACKGLSRVDFFAKADGSIVLNEINTLPGFTSISMFPKLFQASGLSFSEITHRLIQYALQKDATGTV